MKWTNLLVNLIQKEIESLNNFMSIKMGCYQKCFHRKTTGPDNLSQVFKEKIYTNTSENKRCIYQFIYYDLHNINTKT